MEKLIEYIKNPNYIFKTDELKILEKNLKDKTYAETFTDYLINNHSSLNEDAINKIIEFIKKLPTLNTTSSWQITIRIFCNHLYEKLFSSNVLVYLGLSSKEEQSFIPKSQKIINACQEIILTPIEDKLTDEKRTCLINIIKRHAIFYLLPDEKQYKLAITMLNELGVSEEEIKKIREIKKEQLLNIAKYQKPKDKKRT